MENASQALIIAGAILLAILLVAVGMMVFNRTSNSIQNAASQMDQQEVETHNRYFMQYEGIQNGATVKGFLAGWGQRIAPPGTPEERKPELKGVLGSGKSSDEILNAQAKVKTAQRYNVAVEHKNSLVATITITEHK